MKCLNCGGETGGKTVCPYCRMSVKEAVARRKEQDDALRERFEKIDELYGLNANYAKMSAEELEKFIQKINRKFEEDRHAQMLTAAQIEQISLHIDRVGETLQSKFPIRNEAYFTPQKKTVGTSEFIICLLNDYEPPKVAAAAFQLRSACERQIKDYYRFEYELENKQYSKIFSQITHQPYCSPVVSTLIGYRRMLNLFVHGSKANDESIQKKFKTPSEQKQFLIRVLNIFKRYNLIGE